ncbi:MAG TPA: uracil phosphoribosyltransferase [Caulobacteraceae bacterium]|nr:uracil phosphoribosyltransferase [Caulobacteraceae bacterium]
MAAVTVVDHALVQHKLGLMREKGTPMALFRQLLREVSALLCYEVTRDLPMQEIAVETPVARTVVRRLAGKKLVLAPILRAGAGLLEGMLDIVPQARVAHIGLYRDPETLEALEYYFKAPPNLDQRLVIVVDPMLATAHTAVAAVDRLKARGASNLRMLCLVAAPEGVAHFAEHHPDVPVWTAALDERLNDHGYIVPGLGDAGDRLFGT